MSFAVLPTFFVLYQFKDDCFQNVILFMRDIRMGKQNVCCNWLLWTFLSEKTFVNTKNSRSCWINQSTKLWYC